ncbi:MAG TPA: tetratricopeptide repeat protein [Longimicrobium sp.]|nr:tetratricopeptide repeat protein [Longimicrobium sp.]
MRATPSLHASCHRGADFTSPLTIPGGEVAGAEVVRELPPELALTVWQALRSVLMWAAEVPAYRGELFERRAMEQWECELLEGSWDADLRYPVAVIVGELAAPQGASGEAMAHACLCVTEWSLAHNATRTALAFTEAAALCQPDHPRYAWMAGRMLRTHGYRREAEQWIKRSARIASSKGDWEAQTLALNSLGNVLAEGGNYRQAAQTQSQALRIARKHRLREREGEVLHDLFVATAYIGNLDSAENYAREALEIYCPDHARLLPLAHDVAVLWLKRGQFDRAFPVLMALLDHFTQGKQRLLILGSAGWAAGRCGEEAQFQRLSNDALDLVERSITGEAVPRVLYELGLGAWSLERWEFAEDLLMRAEATARLQGEADIIVEAETSLTAVRTRQSAAPAGVAVERAAPGRQTLARHFVATLRTVPVSAEAR